MILDSGLDAACSVDSGPPSGSTAAFMKWVTYAAFGTGSTAPAAGQTGLDAQVGGRINTNGGFNDSVDAGRDATNNVLWYEATFTRVFTIAAPVNATEWGLGTAVSGNLSVRELFRADPLDNGSNPIVLTLAEDDELQLIITIRVEAPWLLESKSFVITGTAGNDAAGTHTGQAGLVTPETTAIDIAFALSTLWPGGAPSEPGTTGLNFAIYSSDQSAIARDSNLAAPDATVKSVPAIYTLGDYYRDVSGTFNTSKANGTHYAFAFERARGTYVDIRSGMAFLLTSPTTIVKTSTHRLVVNMRQTITRL